MNQHNLISIVPSISTIEMTTDKETKNEKRRNLVERIRILNTQLSYMYNLSNDDKRTLNQQYQQHLQKIQNSLLASKVSWNRLLKVEGTLNTIETRIPISESIFHNSYIIPASSPIDLTNDDTIKVGYNSPSIHEDKQGATDLNKEDGASQQNRKDIVPPSVSHCGDKIQKIIDIDDLYKNLTQNSNYVSEHPNLSTAIEVHNTEKHIDKTPALRILEMAKQNTGGSCSPSSMNSASPLLPIVPTPLDVTERVTKLIQILPEEDKIVLKGGVDKVQELVEKKTKISSVLLAGTDDTISTVKLVQLNNSPRLSELLLEQMKTSEAVIHEPIAVDEISRTHPSKPELMKNVSTVKPNDAQSPFQIKKPVNFDTKVVRSNPPISKLAMLKHPSKGLHDKQLAKKTIPRPISNNEKKFLPSRSDMSTLDKTSVLTHDKKLLPQKSDRSAPLPIPNLTNLHIHNLKTKFSQDIGVVHKVGESYKIPPSLKQLKSDRRPSSENSSLNCNMKLPTNVTPSSHSKDPSSRQINPSPISKKNHHRKQVSVSLKKNSMSFNSQPRRRSSEGCLKNKANTLETNNLQNSKLITDFQSPLADIYSTTSPTVRTGLGYGAQKQFKNTYKIPKLNKNDKSEENKSMMHSHVLKDDILDVSEISTTQSILVEENKTGLMNVHKSKDKKLSSNQNIWQPKQVVLKTPTAGDTKQDSRTPDEFCRKSFQNSEVEELEEDRKCVTNVHTKICQPNKLQKTSASFPTDNIKENTKLDGVDQLDLDEYSKKKLGDPTVKDITVEIPTKDDMLQEEKLLEKSTAEVFTKNDLPQAKPFCIVLEGLDSTCDKKKSSFKAMLKEDEAIKNVSVELVDCTRETSEDTRKSSIHSGKYIKQKQITLLEPVTNMQNIDNLNLQSTTNFNKNDLNHFKKSTRRKHFKSRKLVNSLDSSDETGTDSDSNNLSQMRSDMDMKNSKRIRRKSTHLLKLSSTSEDESELGMEPVNTNRMSNEEIVHPVPSLPYSNRSQLSCNCTCAKDIMKILEEFNEENIGVIPDLSVPNHPVVEDSKRNNLSSLSEEVIEEASNEKSMPEASECLTNESSIANQKAKGKKYDADLLDFLKSSSELEDIRGILDKVDVSEVNWCMHFIRLLPPDQLQIVQRLINSYYLEPDAFSKNTKSENNVEAYQDNTNVNECQDSAARNSDQKIDSAEPTQILTKPRKKRELDRLHEDIKKMKKTKNNIFTAIGERKCRQQSKSYHESPIKPRDSPVLFSTQVATSSSDDSALLSDDSSHSEKRLRGRPSVSAASISDDNSSSYQFMTRSKMQKVKRNPTRRGRRGRPPLRTIQSRWEISTAELKPKMQKKYKAGPRCMKLKLYGEEALGNDNIVKPLCVSIPKVQVPVFPSSPEINLCGLGESVEIADEVDIVKTEQVSSNIKKKKKKKKSREKKAKENEHLKKMLEECENTATTLNLLSTEERRRSGTLFQESDADLKKDFQEEPINQRIACLPECNAFRGTDITCAQILSIAIEYDNSKLLYKCVGPECNYSNSDAKKFASHVSSLHKDVIWKGDCPICFETVIMDSRADLIDALSHLMKEHLTRTSLNVVTVILSDDDEETPTPNEMKEFYGPVNMGDGEVIRIDDKEECLTQNDRTKDESVTTLTGVGDVSEKETSTETSAPRLRVRRLSGDILSGVNSSSTPKDSATQSVSNTNDGFEDLALSLVIKEVKTIREKELPAFLPCHRERSAQNVRSSAITNLHSEEQRKNEENIVLKVLSKSAQSEISIVKLYKCGGTSWNNPEMCKFSSEKSDDFLLHLYRNHMVTNNDKEKKVAKKFLKCIYCSVQNADAEKMVHHIDNVHGVCLFQCAFCEYRAARPVYLDWHRESDHKLGEKKILITELKDNKDEVLKRSRSRQWSKPYQDIVFPFTCTRGCTYSTYSEKQFIEHSEAHHSGVQTWDCSLCDHKCFDLSKLMMHYKVHGMAKFQCRYCLHGVQNVEGLMIHLSKLHPHLYPSALERKPSSSGDETANDPWVTRVKDIDFDRPLSNFKSYLKVINVNSRPTQTCDLGESNSTNKVSVAAVLPMSIAEETEAAVSAITSSGNDCRAITCQQNETRRASSSGAVSLCSSDDDISDRLIINEDEFDDCNSTIAERLRQTRRTSAEIQQPTVSRLRASKDYIRGLTGNSLFKCGVAGCTISVDDYKAYGEHLRVCDNARNSTGFECPHCDYKVQTTKAFLNHLTLHGPARYQCTLCDFKHQQSKHVVEHMKSSAHRILGEPKIMPINPLKNDKHEDIFIVRFDSDKIVRNKSELKSIPITQRLSASVSTYPSEQTKQITTVNSSEDVEKHLHMQLFREFIYCGICNYKDRVRSNLLNHMKEHACGGLPISQNIVNPVPRIGKDQTDLMFNKMSNHAGFSAKNDNKLNEKAKDEMTNNSDGSEKMPLIIPEFVPKMRRYVCSAPDCRYFSQDACGLRNHYSNLHTDMTEFMCPHCQISVAPLKISVHLRYHGEKLYRCAICRKYVHFQRSGIEKHQKEKHTNSSYDIEVLREVSLTDSEQSDYSDTAFNKLVKCCWKCNLCGDRFGSEYLVKTHCQMRHSISYQYKCGLCQFGTFQKEDINEHLETNHQTSSKILLAIYKEVDDQVTGSLLEQQKLKIPEVSVTRDSEANCSSNLTPPSLCSSNHMEMDCVKQNSSTTLDTAHSQNVKESNEMIVDPYPDLCFRCPFCETYKTVDVKEMRYHLFREKNYDRYVCNGCGKLGVNREDLETHIIQEINTHPPKNQDYISKFTADPMLEPKIKEALLHQYKKMKPDSMDDPFSSLDSDEDSLGPTHSITQNFKNKQTLLVNRSKKQTMPDNNPVYCCSTCNKIFASQKGLNRHRNSHKPKSSDSQTPRKRARRELLSTNNTTMPPKCRDENEERNQVNCVKRFRPSPSAERTLVDSNPEFQCEVCDEIFDKTSEFHKHQRMVHQPYPCLRCDKILLGERNLIDHVQTSYRLQHNNQPNYVCEKSATRKVLLKCSSSECPFSYTNASYQNYERIIRHMRAVHQTQTEYSIMVEIDDLEPRPLTDIEVSYLQANELPSAQRVPKAPPKRRNVAVKSTMRSTAMMFTEPLSKLMFVDAVTTVACNQTSTSIITTTAGHSSLLAPQITRPKDENNTDLTTPSMEVIDLSDDAAEKND